MMKILSENIYKDLQVKKKKMKGAILISGAYKNATVPILELLNWFRKHENYEIDVFIHAWWDKSYVGKRYRHDHLSIVEEDPTQEILEKIKPKRFLLEPQCKVDFTDLPFKVEAGGTPYLREIAYFAIFSQMESLKRCFNLVENPDQYDFIMRLRGDLYITEESYRMQLTKEDFTANNVYISDGQFFTGWPFGDWTYVARPKIMELFILHQEKIFRHICKELGYCPHIHIYMPTIFKMIGVNPIRWYIPLKITRLSDKHSNHLLMDTNENREDKDPFFWDLIDKKRLEVPL